MNWLIETWNGWKHFQLFETPFSLWNKDVAETLTKPETLIALHALKKKKHFDRPKQWKDLKHHPGKT
jgi:hypothetical protein